ncbi:ArsR/SmtB family transcription factor [Nocardioides renjunii]|uniref:ArsR/SmtB family transcription factor n=1 Tax=Nocardioides renjunii TaxID=3095075 RepID=UPI002AFFCAF1|nr:metalloregulator ArsR/SmtB family transcription factor [Nocardioides sp. S-34]WQQ21457.1 metalloregulator ArsR/SmtB family transcription factor [Nocardioides sp. S-34]
MDPFAALADPVRRGLVARLARGPARVVDLAADHDVSRPAVSRHLRLLADAGLVSAEDRGRERHYRFEAAGLGVVRDWLDGLEPDAPSSDVRFAESVLDGLDLEVRRTTRERAADRPADRSDRSDRSDDRSDHAEETA